MIPVVAFFLLLCAGFASIWTGLVVDSPQPSDLRLLFSVWYGSALVGGAIMGADVRLTGQVFWKLSIAVYVFNVVCFGWADLSGGVTAGICATSGFVAYCAHRTTIWGRSRLERRP